MLSNDAVETKVKVFLSSPPHHPQPLPPTLSPPPFNISTKATLYVLQLCTFSLSSLLMPMWALVYLNAFKNSLLFVRKFCLTLEAFVPSGDGKYAVYPLNQHICWISDWSCVLFKALGVNHEQDRHGSTHLHTLQDIHPWVYTRVSLGYACISQNTHKESELQTSSDNF